MGWWDVRKEKNKEKDDEFWLLWGVFNDYIKQNIIMVVLRKVDISFSWHLHVDDKNQSYKKIQGEKLMQALIFSKLPSVHKVLRRGK